MVMIVIAVLIGLVAVVLATRLLQQASMATTKVVVASRDLDLGMRLAPDMLQTVDWPKTALPKGASSNRDDLLNAKTPEGKTEARVLKANIARGEPILESKLAPIGAAGGLAAALEEGMRAITVRVNEIVGVAGFALPGSRVDLLVHTQDEANKPISKIVLESVKVIAIAQETQADPNKPKVVSAVTLEVTPEQAEKIDLARSIGTLSLVLRNEMDRNVVVTKGAEKASLLRGTGFQPEVKAEKKEEVPAAKPVIRKERVIVYRSRPAPPKESVEVIRGTKKSTEEF